MLPPDTKQRTPGRYDLHPERSAHNWRFAYVSQNVSIICLTASKRTSTKMRPASASPITSSAPSCSAAGPATVYATAAVALPLASDIRALAGGSGPAGKADVASTAPSPGPPESRAKNRVACGAAAAAAEAVELDSGSRVKTVGAGVDAPTSKASPAAVAAIARPLSRPDPP